MLSHEQVWSAIDQLAENNRLTPSGLARQSGLDPTSFNKSKRMTSEGRLRWPSTESIAKALSATRTPFSEFANIVRGEPHFALRQKMDHKQPDAMGFSQAGVANFCDDGGLPALQKSANDPVHPFEEPDSFTMKITGDELDPVYRHGDTIIAVHERAVKPGARIIIELQDQSVLIRDFLSINGGEMKVATLTDPKLESVIPRAKIAKIARILWVSQ